MTTNRQLLQNEINGFVELGLNQDAIRLIRSTLNRQQISGEEFITSVNGLLRCADHLVRWHEKICQAYNRLPHREQNLARSSMFLFLATIEHWQQAALFAPRSSEDPAELLFMMWTHLHLRDLKSARRVALQCHKALRRIEDEDQVFSLFHALGDYYAQVGNWDQAEESWEILTRSEIFHRNAVENLVQLHALRGLVLAQQELASEDGLAAHTRLSRRLAHLERVVPTSERWRFGLEFLAQ